jgi:mannitol operon repressor
VPDSKRHKGGKRLPKGTGRPSGKDRTAHVAAREKKVGASVSLSKYDPTNEEFEQSLREMHEGSDRVAAILGAALVESELRNLIRIALKDKSDVNALMEDRSAPLSTFSARTLVGKAFGLFDASLANEMDVIRSVRNDFAHALLSINFDHPIVVARCNKLPDRRSRTAVELGVERNENLSPARERYEGACWHVTTTLLRKSNVILKGAEAEYDLKTLMSAGGLAGIVATGLKGGDDNGKS